MTLKNLAFLDDRPIFEDERRCARAFFQGGIEAEREELKKIREEKLAAAEKNRQGAGPHVNSSAALVMPADAFGGLGT